MKKQRPMSQPLPSPAICVAALAVGFALDAVAAPVFRIAPPVPACDWDTGAMRTFTNATELVQGAIDDAFRAGGGEVRVAPGLYSIRGIRLRGGVTLHLEAGAVLAASRLSAPGTERYPALPCRAQDRACRAQDRAGQMASHLAVSPLARAHGSAPRARPVLCPERSVLCRARQRPVLLPPNPRHDHATFP